MIRCLVVDDEPLARQLMEGHIRQVKSLSLVASCETAMEAFEWLHKESIDLLFLDIQMPGISGLSFLRSLKSPPRVIFTTAFMEHAVEAFELDAVDYLLKPVTFERFIKAVNKLTVSGEKSSPQSESASTDAIFVKVNKRLIRIGHQDIAFVEAFGDYIKIHTVDAVHVSYLSLSRIEELLPAFKFVRIHKSYILNLQHVKFVEGNLVRVLDKELPVGITYREALMKKIGAD